MDRTPGYARHMTKEEWRKRMNMNAAAYVLASNNPFSVLHYSEKYIAGARKIIEEAKKEGYLGGNDDGKRD